MSNVPDNESPRLINENELPANLRNLWDKAVKALRMQNYDYVTQLLAPIVKEQPFFLDARRALRKCQLQLKSSGGKKKGGLLSAGSGMASVMKLKPLVQKDPLAGLQAIEEQLAEDPSGKALNELFAEAAAAAKLPELAAFGYETLRDAYPTDTTYLKKLAEIYHRNGQYQKAVDAYTKVTQLNPSDLEATRGVMRASADLSMEKNKLEEGGTKKDEEEIKNLELMSRTHLTEDQARKQLEQFLVQYNENNENIVVVKRIAMLYERLNDLDSAISYQEWALHLSKGDMALASKVNELKEKKRDIEFAEMEKAIAADPNAPDVEEKKARIEELKRERLEQKIAYAKGEVDKNPTDPALRFLLASHLFAAGMATEAIPELQRAKTNPHVRIKALLMLGRCFVQKNMLDLAINQFVEAEKELPGLDDTKKQLVYERALVHELRNEKEEYLDALKQIYEVDYGYKDVAQRVESSYS